jgi:hypothetical protein
MTTETTIKGLSQEIGAMVRDLLTVQFLAKREKKARAMGPSFAKKLFSYVAELTDGVIANVAKTCRFKTDADVLACFSQLVTHPRTGDCANLYAVEKFAGLACAMTPGELDLYKIDDHTACYLANMSRFGFSMTIDEMKGTDGYYGSDTLRSRRALVEGKARALQGYGEGTVGTQASSTGMALAAFGLAHYDGKRLTVRDDDKVLRKIIAAYDKLSDSELVAVLHTSARATYSPASKGATVS